MKLLSRKLFPIIIISLSTLFCCTPYVYGYSNEDLNDGAVIPAFPGAEGFGAYTFGGRGDGSQMPKIIAVDTLEDRVADDGRTSLREAVQTSGPRIVVFRVGGVIFLHKDLKIIEPFITIAGQTAPGPGITLAHHGISIVKGCHDVVIRYIRIRIFFVEGDNGAVMDGILLYGRDVTEMVYNVVIDHCSIAWAIDENINSWDYVRDYTIQWCLIAEGATYGHEKGWHSMGFLSGGKGSKGLTRGSLHHNLFAHNVDRNPRIHGGHTFDISNNVVYGWYNVSAAAFVSSVQVNFVNNYYIAGIDTAPVDERRHIISVPPPSSYDIPKIYIKGNIAPLRLNQNLDEWDIGVVWFSKKTDGTYKFTAADRNMYGLGKPALAPDITIDDAETALVDVLEKAGVVFPGRDKVDSRIVEEIRYVVQKYPRQKASRDNRNLRGGGPNDGRIANVLWFRPKFDPKYLKYLPRQYRIRDGQSVKKAKEALLNLMEIKGRITADEKKDLVNNRSSTHEWELVKRTIPDEETVVQIMPDLNFPVLLDSDGDGLPDGWENENGSSPYSNDTDRDGVADGLEDDDSDGYLNIEEYINALPSIDFGILPKIG